MIRILLIAALVVVASDAGGDELEDETRRLSILAIDRMLEGQARVMRVADPIRVAGRPFCGDEVGPVVGAYPLDERSLRDLFDREKFLEEAMLGAARAHVGLERRPTILVVVPGLPADVAGVQAGDVITRIDGKKPKRRDRFNVLKQRDVPIQLQVERDGATHEFEIQVLEGCRFPSRYWWSTSINAFATRWGHLTGMYVLGGLLEFLPSDDDLAVILGHELAHLILNHAGGGPTTQNTEADADYLGLYLAARAGFDVSRAPDVWDRFARKNPYAGIDWGFYAHPSSGKRALSLRATLDEIAAKREQGAPLEPETGR